ncbi:galactose mutarotase [Alteromonadaceae bacterium M269]|nr:galactose mutarotase [Alteromonadaceae bacterium M269]
MDDMHFGQTPEGQEIEQFRLSNSHGTFVDILTLGAIVRRFCVVTQDKQQRDIVLGFDDAESYFSNEHYLGCVVGRYANRIHKGSFSIGNNKYQADINQAGNCLHGGSNGFNKRVWKVKNVSSQQLRLSLFSEDGDQGFPGNLNLEVTYMLSDDNELIIHYQANSDKATVFNPTQHSYFNLDGHQADSIKEHKLHIHANHVLEVNENGIPSGHLKTVPGTDFDFNQEATLSNSLTSGDPLIVQAKGLDHNWCLADNSIDKTCARLTSSTNDLALEVKTTMPGLQIYTANFLSLDNGKDGCEYKPHQAICLETQFYPDSPNQEEFPSALLREGDVFRSETRYKVTVH